MFSELKKGEWALEAIGSLLAGVMGGMGAAMLNNFVGEDYRRFRDAAALAGALAGELDAHAKSIREIRSKLLQWSEGPATREPIRKFSPPTDPVFDSSVAKLGLLGPKLAGKVASIYQEMRQIRADLMIIAQEVKEMQSAELSARLGRCVALLNVSEPRALALISDLKIFTGRRYFLWGWVFVLVTGVFGKREIDSPV
ncbi:hypothetical protein SAMN04487926_12244 [Paraburkholderia steynii]|uniref:Uncharacterized protein n=1 Tax=Paraburkholderia steynii TaxID=1245441 RepID=A0A7Z7FJY6_9BURK|nr:hypothetical protein [Paraburkholderia steynii]SDI70360.1 hypothetical protein SAMN04487926_12244 [Paraburkholderia steynii]